ncbi:regulator of chromosome condensation, RCC1 [Candidatus Magnetoovum chiemensis]|nr:regulator of chromosome condensation, RCC1 [Candidatus Magnetoovum chiemensis]
MKIFLFSLYWPAGSYLGFIHLSRDGSVWCWGENSNGQLGDGTTEDRSLPIQVIGISDISAIAAGEDHTVALKENGTVFTWGENIYGQLGNFPQSYGIPTPVDVLFPTATNVAPVYIGDTVNLGNGDTLNGKMELKVNFPAYNTPIDIWIVIELPDGRYYLIDELGNILSMESKGFVPFAINILDTTIKKQILLPFEIDSLETPFDPFPDSGTWIVYWLLAHESSGDITEAIQKGGYEFGYYDFQVLND